MASEQTDSLQHESPRRADYPGEHLTATRSAVVILDRHLTVTYWDESAERLFGYSAAEMVGASLLSLLTDRLRERHQRAIAELASREAATLPTMRGVVRRRDGTEFPIEASLSRWESNGEAFFTVTIRDVLASAKKEEADRRVKLMIENSPVAFFVWRAEETLPVEYVSDSIARFGYRPEDFYSGRLGFVDLIHPDDLDRVANEAAQFEREQRQEYRQSFRLLAGDGSVRWVDNWTLVQLDADGEVVNYLGLISDITDRKSTEEALRESEERFRAVIEQSRDGISMWTPDGRVVLYNKAMERISGYTREEVNRDGWYNLVFPDPETRAQAIRLSMRVMLGKLSYFEVPIVRKDGETAWLSFSFTPVEVGGRQYNLSVTTDITQRKLQEQQLTFLSTHDSLTGLPNRRLLEDALKRVAARVQRGAQAALLYLDVDNLKLINDSAGHHAGDRVLVTIASLLRERVRPDDLLARLGGDEFAVLLEDSDAEGAREVAERLRLAVDETRFSFDGHTFNLGLSIGVAVVASDQPSGAALSQADVAMCRAKEMGRNRVVVYRPEEDDVSRSSEANRLVIRLKEALREGRFDVYYQPIVRLNDGAIEHHEALIRLRDRSGQLVLPGSFMYAAERFGLMPQLTRWVIQETVSSLRTHPEARVFVNLSGHCLAEEQLLEFIEGSLRDSEVEPRRLGFEITETVMVQDLALAERWMKHLKALGCRFALDDFGSGFSTLVYLRSLPVDQLKIDGSLVRKLEDDPTQRMLVQVIQALAATMGKEVVAEHVENEGIAQVLREIGVPLGQGYHLGRPEPGLPPSRVYLPR